MSMQGKEKRPAWGRRGFLKTIGASALGTAMVIFGTPGRAEAGPFCCNLAFSPSISYDSCRASSNYTWVCMTDTKTCQCCEKKNSSGQYTASAYFCSNV
ncbi:twin-arginine translocation signal domain-containing protein [Micromonospora sp. NPDC048999]|uniref:twin-arginine translocation signal domain-containing protein n=1 Tax=Micromonospora sp. NPDC048999 TaxID=3155391 RepID=UPI0033F01EAF